jgi:hypothetical protein
MLLKGYTDRTNIAAICDHESEGHGILCRCQERSLRHITTTSDRSVLDILPYVYLRRRIDGDIVATPAVRVASTIGHTDRHIVDPGASEGIAGILCRRYLCPIYSP